MSKKKIFALLLSVIMVFTCSVSAFAYTNAYIDSTNFYVYVPNKYDALGLFKPCIGYSGAIITPKDGNTLYISPDARIYGTIAKEVTYSDGQIIYDHTIAEFNRCTITRTAGTGTVSTVSYTLDNGPMYPGTSYYLQFNAQPGDKFTLTYYNSSITPSPVYCYFIVQ